MTFNKKTSRILYQIYKSLNYFLYEFNALLFYLYYCRTLNLLRMHLKLGKLKLIWT